MSSHQDKCFVLLPTGKARYETLYNELFALAITAAGLLPHRIPEDTHAPLPINDVVHAISEADAFFADISENVPQIWLALGFAMALNKPVCLISSRAEPNLPIDLQSLAVIPYPLDPFPSDYLELKRSITQQLADNFPGIDASRPDRSEASVPYIGATGVQGANSIQTPASAPVVVSVPLHTDELTSYEILALTIIDRDATEDGLSPRDLGMEMRNNKFSHLTSHAMNALKRRKFIQRKAVNVMDGTISHISDNLFLTPLGERWLIRNGKRRSMQQRSSSIADRQDPARHDTQLARTV